MKCDFCGKKFAKDRLNEHRTRPHGYNAMESVNQKHKVY